MGQYYKVINLDKKQFLNPYAFGEGIKLLEFIPASCGALTGLGILLASGNGRGGGDTSTRISYPAKKKDEVLYEIDWVCEEIVGSWAGDRIVIAGDYDDEGKFLTQEDCAGLSISERKKGKTVTVPASLKNINLYHVAAEKFKDISHLTLYAMFHERWIYQEFNPKKARGELGILWNEIHTLAKTRKRDLPLLVGSLKTLEAREILDKRLKNIREIKPPKNV